MTHEQEIEVHKKIIQILLEAIKSTPGGTSTLGKLAIEKPEIFYMIAHLLRN